MTDEKTLQEVYEDRNLLAVAFCELYRFHSLALRSDPLDPADPGTGGAGWTEPDADDADADEWAIVWARLETGLVSWHVPRALAEQSPLPRRPHDYDGHTRKDKNRRLERFTRQG